ncbi:MAG: hypothetical protein AVDCRST_MAG41-83, partial [uncultured Corynebacteriales bacterium]
EPARRARTPARPGHGGRPRRRPGTARPVRPHPRPGRGR